MRSRNLASAKRRGNYSLMVAVSTVAFLGIGALTIDVAHMRLSHAQAQDVADAAAHAGLVALRASGDQSVATAAAQAIVDANFVAGEAPQMTEINFGHWDTYADEPVLDGDHSNPNAVQVLIARQGEEAVPTTLARLMGINEFEVEASAIAATRSFQVILVMDITNSWSERNFLHAREASLVALDMMSSTANGLDQMGMTIFTNRFAWEYSPLTNIAVGANVDLLEEEWEKLNTASKAGRDNNHSDGNNCSLNGGSDKNNFEDPVVGGCYPDMPREYRDEPGTDHSAGMLLARQMLEESASTADYRAILVLTDGQPNGLGSPGTARAADGFEEDRWREYLGPAPRSRNDIRYASIEAAEDLWNDMAVHTWVVSFVADDWMMPQMAQGDGYYFRTSNPNALEAIFAQIMSEMPLAIVR